ncbi:hypothetical protein [Pedobacter sp. NJ-S-72]
MAQEITKVTLSGTIRDSRTKTTIPFGNLQLKTTKDSTFVSGTVSDSDGRFKLA